MSRSRVVISLLVLIVAIVIQTTIFAQGGFNFFGVGPALVTLALIAICLRVEPGYLLVLGFTAGMLMDLIGGGTLGLWAMVLTTVAYSAGRLRSLFRERSPFVVAIVFGLTVMGQLLYVILGTLFGQGTVTTSGVVGMILLPGVWNLVLLLPVFWVLDRVYGFKRGRWDS